MTPLTRRLPRELRRNIGKYLGIFLVVDNVTYAIPGYMAGSDTVAGAGESITTPDRPSKQNPSTSPLD